MDAMQSKSQEDYLENVETDDLIPKSVWKCAEPRTATRKLKESRCQISAVIANLCHKKSATRRKENSETDLGSIYDKCDNGMLWGKGLSLITGAGSTQLHIHRKKTNFDP